MIKFADGETVSICTGELTAFFCRDGCGRWFVYAPSDRVTIRGKDGERFVSCPCGKKHVLAIGSIQ